MCPSFCGAWQASAGPQAFAPDGRGFGNRAGGSPAPGLPTKV